MDEISLSNFRCFRELQTVRLAPLTLLVGENSSGKTSFMALIRALWDIAYAERIPDFKEGPYDLGSFDEIAHHRGARGGRASEFFAGFRGARTGKRGESRKVEPFEFQATFRKQGTGPFPMKVRLARGATWVEYLSEGSSHLLHFGTDRGAWKSPTFRRYARSRIDGARSIMPWYIAFGRVAGAEARGEEGLTHVAGAPEPNDDDFSQIRRLYHSTGASFRYPLALYASAPVRSMPRRTYDPAPAETDPEGQYVPMYLATIYYEEPNEWEQLKVRLEGFGRSAGLFDEISIRPLGNRNSEPFQIQIRKFTGKRKGPRRNLIDVGYGVSQALPLITELLRKDRPPMFLLQQPEVHLHPSAQAALGSLFCQIAQPSRQLVVETHSDHLLDRIRMDIRDRTTELTPDDVSILFFERDGLDVCIHSLRLDKKGNVLDAPDTYRRFFLEEMVRSIGL